MEETAPSVGDSARSSRPSGEERWVPPIIAALLIVVSGIVLTFLIYPFPPPGRTFVALLAVAGALVVGGLSTLMYLIPSAASNREVKTEFYSARAAYLCVLAGLLLSVIVAIGAVFAAVVLLIGRP